MTSRDREIHNTLLFFNVGQMSHSKQWRQYARKPLPPSLRSVCADPLGVSQRNCDASPVIAGSKLKPAEITSDPDSTYSILAIHSVRKYKPQK
jgi:hypothetical protein